MTAPGSLSTSRAARRAYDPRVVLLVASVVVATAAAIKVWLHPVAWDGVNHASYNNFIIFRNAFLNLAAHRDIYAWHLDQQWDLYKYSPAFAVLMAPFAFMPTLPGMVLWSLLNTVPLVIAIRLLPLDTRSSSLFVYLVLIELVTSVQSAQSNGLVAALFLLTFAMLERRQVALAALFTALNVAIKVFGGAGLLLFVMYPRKARSAAWTLAWVVLLAALPLLLVGPSELVATYRAWFALLRQDTVRANTVSFYGWLEAWFRVSPPRQIVLAASVALLVLPLARMRLYRDETFRLLVLASLLIWAVVFNHKAESPTFVIAMCGVATWFFAMPASWLNRALLLLAFVFVSLSPTDLFPRAFRQAVFVPYGLKVVPCIAIWLLITAQLIFGWRRPVDGTAEVREGDAV
ncbi:MAG: glycosyltransferase family 87 protein [Bacteroidales bacterium]